VPAVIRERDRVIGESRISVLRKYERICFERDYIHVHGKPLAELLNPGHPLMRAMTDLILSSHRTKLKQGAVLVDPNDDGLAPKILFMIDHQVRESTGARQTVASRRLQFVAIDSEGKSVNAGWGPHLDLLPIGPNDLDQIDDVLQAPWITGDLEKFALNHAIRYLVPEHYNEVKNRRERQADKILSAVTERLVKEINFWSGRFIQLSEETAAGKQPRMQPEMARRRVEDLRARLDQRKKELDTMKNVVSSTPVVVGGALVIPKGLLAKRKGEPEHCVDAAARTHIEKIAMQAVMEAERRLGHGIKDVSDDKCGWDITACPKRIGDRLPDDRHIEVKGRAKGHRTITVSRNEIIYGLNQADKFILAIVLVDGSDYEGPYYVRNPFEQEPDFGVASINYDLDDLLSKAVSPEQTL